ncbi:DYW domain [Dillenia turbinata]|uniref:DYW domain n=1 Tax=Dillenia turbinata TaxID=194707 RepID=A0AAN8Z9W9_9MAGN
MKQRGCEGGSAGLVFVDVEEEAEEDLVCLHSERLALASGLLTIPKGLIIKVMKNLRVCRDGHEFFKLISDIEERDFVVRDVNRFDHFKSGKCSCNDKWTLRLHQPLEGLKLTKAISIHEVTLDLLPVNSKCLKSIRTWICVLVGFLVDDA